MRNKIVIANWKMNKTLIETKEFVKQLRRGLGKSNVNEKRVLIAPSFTTLSTAVKLCERSIIEVIAQNVHEAKNGAYTGEVSISMLTEIGVKKVILGHSERREYFCETNQMLAKKVNTALANDFEIVFCIGESLDQRNNKKHFQTIENQLKDSLFHLLEDNFNKLILAYEPIWAIGTGIVALPEQVQEMHLFIRQKLVKEYSVSVAEKVPILYGGSIRPSNAEQIFSMPDVDGGLVGGASLAVQDFLAIINTLSKIEAKA
ncbi:MAG: triose-phosphate isomerase [Tenacibaculum sp.]